MSHIHRDKYADIKQQHPRLGGSHYFAICACGAYRRYDNHQPVGPWQEEPHEKEIRQEEVSVSS
jgi:hypothetical protein